MTADRTCVEDKGGLFFPLPGPHTYRLFAEDAQRADRPNLPMKFLRLFILPIVCVAVGLMIATFILIPIERTATSLDALKASVTKMAANDLEDTKQRLASESKQATDIAATRVAIAIQEDSIAKLRAEMSELRGRLRQTK